MTTFQLLTTRRLTTYWVHAFVTFVLVFPGGFKLPVYLYPLKKSQIDISASDEKLKQECELQAAQRCLPELKLKLGRIPITFLGDSLYANEPMIKLLEELNWDYLIVFWLIKKTNFGGKLSFRQQLRARAQPLAIHSNQD